MSTPFQVGITGGIGSGKSTVAKIFSTLGTPVYDADSHAKVLMNSDGILVEQLKKEFGPLVYDGASQLNRKYLSDQVFGFPERLKKLNSLVHPRVAEDYKNWVKQHQAYAYVMKEAALLFESGSADQLNKIIVVTAPEAIRIKRVMSRDKRSEQEVLSIIKQQWPEKQSLEKADYTITNDEANAIIPQVLKLHQVFLKLTESK